MHMEIVIQNTFKGTEKITGLGIMEVTDIEINFTEDNSQHIMEYLRTNSRYTVIVNANNTHITPLIKAMVTYQHIQTVIETYVQHKYLKAVWRKF